MSNPTYRAYVIHNTIAGLFINKIKPVSVNRTRNEYKAAKYEAWWRDNGSLAEMKYQYAAHPGRIAVVKGYNKLIDIGNIELNPAARKRKAEKMKELQSRVHERNEMREKRKEAKIKRKQDKAQREHIRAMQRIAH